MYFKSRAEAGRLLAKKLKKYNKHNCAVVALNPGAVIIGAQIAMQTHASLMLLLSEKINLPGEPDALAAMTSGTFTYNHMYSAGQLEEIIGDYQSLIEGQRIEKLHKLNRLLVAGGEIDPKKLRHHVVILVSDALQTGISLEVAADFLKPIKMKKLIVATPLASVNAVDRMHLLGDEIYCLSVVDNLMEADHYYDDNYVPSQEQIVTLTHNISLNWQT